MTEGKGLRAAVLGDIEPLADIWYDGWHEAHGAHVPIELTRLRTHRSFTARFSTLLDRTMVHEIGGRPTGFCTLLCDELMQLFVCRTDRGTGTATALLVDGERRLAAAGTTTGWLSCVIGNSRARRFYLRSGWRQVGTMIYQAPTEAGDFPVEEWRLEKQFSSES
jgi:GNAT superfamily N-acetyltransferase